LNLKLIRIMGLLILILGFVLAFGAATYDIFTGGSDVGDSQVGAFFISMAVLLFGLLLLQFAANGELKNRIKDIEKLHKNVKAGSLKGLSKLYTSLGTIGALLGLVMILGLVLKDYSPLITFDIGPIQMLAIFSGASLALVGIGFMAMGNTVISGSMGPMVLQLEALTKEERTAEVPPGKPMKVKRVVRSPAIDADTGEVEPAGEVEVEVEEPVEEEEPVGPSPEPYYAGTIYDIEAAPAHEEGQVHATEEAPTEEYAADEQPGVVEAEVPMVSEEPPIPEGPPEAEEPVITEEVPPATEETWSSVEQETEQFVTDMPADTEKDHRGILDEEEGGIPGPELAGTEVSGSEVSDTSEEMETEEVVEEFLCPSCQMAVGENDTACPHCGVKFSEEEEMVMEESAEAIEGPPTVEEPPSIEDVGGDHVAAEEVLPSSKILAGILTEISRLDSKAKEAEPEVEQDEAAEIPATCPKCGRNLKPRWKSCPYCGLEFR